MRVISWTPHRHRTEPGAAYSCPEVSDSLQSQATHFSSASAMRHPSQCPIREKLLLSPLHRWGNWGTKNLIDLPEVTHRWNVGKLGFQHRSLWVPNPNPSGISLLDPVFTLHTPRRYRPRWWPAWLLSLWNVATAACWNDDILDVLGYIENITQINFIWSSWCFENVLLEMHNFCVWLPFHFSWRVLAKKIPRCVTTEPRRRPSRAGRGQCGVGLWAAGVAPSPPATKANLPLLQRDRMSHSQRFCRSIL